MYICNFLIWIWKNAMSHEGGGGRYIVTGRDMEDGGRQMYWKMCDEVYGQPLKMIMDESVAIYRKWTMVVGCWFQLHVEMSTFQNNKSLHLKMAFCSTRDSSII